MELETHLLIVTKLCYLKADELEPAMALAAEVGRMLAGLTRRLKAHLPST